MNICLHCNKNTDNPKFCNSSCSASYNNKNRTSSFKDDKRTKILQCSVCGKDVDVNIRAGSIRCRDCKKQKSTRKCKTCGLEKCKPPKLCNKFVLLPTLIDHLGFNKDVIGTPKVYEEFDKIKDILIDEYINNEMSLNDIVKKYGMKDCSNPAIRYIFKALGIKRRTFEEACRLASFKGRMIPKKPNGNYKQGWHTTWNDKKVFYRSSYELNYCKILDEQKIAYEMESKRFWYWDSQEQKQRVAIPDFYIPYNNMIVEIKCEYSLDEQNMRDKEKAYREHDYNFKLIVDGKER